MGRVISRTYTRENSIRKDVLEKIDDTYYLVKSFRHTEEDGWFQIYATRSEYLVGAKGRVLTRALHDVDRYFDLVCEYEGFQEGVDYD